MTAPAVAGRRSLDGDRAATDEQHRAAASFRDTEQIAIGRVGFQPDRQDRPKTKKACGSEREPQASVMRWS
jgi:hypothetical protein